MVKNSSAVQDILVKLNSLVKFLGWEDPLEKGMAPVFLLGEFHGQRSLVGYSPWGRKELDMTKQLTFLLLSLLHQKKVTN